jgi:hypothetical protein
MNCLWAPNAQLEAKTDIHLQSKFDLTSLLKDNAPERRWRCDITLYTIVVLCTDVTIELTKYMEQNSYWETNGQGIPHAFWNVSILCILGQMNPVNALPSVIFKINFNIILPSTSRSPKLSLSFRQPHKKNWLYIFLPLTCHTPCPSLPPWLDNLNSIWWEVHVMMLFIIAVQFISTKGGGAGVQRMVASINLIQ